MLDEVTEDCIGRWTADIYLLMALRRPDAWPTGDLAAIGEAWRPWRAIAARILWHFHLSGGVQRK